MINISDGCDSIYVDIINMNCRCGALINDCIKEAVMVSLKFNCKVSIIHSARNVVIDSSEVIQKYLEKAK